MRLSLLKDDSAEAPWRSGKSTQVDAPTLRERAFGRGAATWSDYRLSLFTALSRRRHHDVGFQHAAGLERNSGPNEALHTIGDRSLRWFVARLHV